jgi:thiol-disulfide isomerase/thioredoxin
MRNGLILVALLMMCPLLWAQSVPRTVLLDHNGKEISNNEFVDIRMANFQYRDATIQRVRDDGTIEFRLQKIPQEGETAPLVTFRTLSGEKFDMAALRGKVVVLNFWFIGCASCLAHQPKLNSLKAKFDGQKDVIFLAATADPASDVRGYLRKQPFDLIQAADASEQLKAFRFSGYPRNIVISKTGEIVYWRTTVHAWDKFESVIRTELAK